MNGFLLLRNIRVENANAISGQTWGFPAITHFMGFMHALERKLSNHEELGNRLHFAGCAVICHDLQPQTTQVAPYSEHVFSLTRNPLTKEAKSPSFVEEGRTHMTVSLMIGIHDFVDQGEHENKQLEAHIRKLVLTQRLAGGTITNLTSARLANIEEGADEQKQQMNFWLRTLLPGFALVGRPDLLIKHSQEFADEPNPEFSAWLDNSTLHRDKEGNIAERDYKGWVRPIVVGYKAISPLYQAEEVARSRDETTPVRFVEYAYSLGEWISPHRINDLNQLLWHYQTDTDRGWYLCQNHYSTNLTETA